MMPPQLPASMALQPMRCSAAPLRSVIVVPAALQGGTGPLTGAGATVECHGVALVRGATRPAWGAVDAPALQVLPVADFLQSTLYKEGALHQDLQVDSVAARQVVHAGSVWCA
jgi:NAD/NADP transhydrogenase alpha subunit